MKNKAKKGSIFHQILFALIGVFLIVIIFSILILFKYHKVNQNQKLEDYSKTIGVSLSHFYQRAIAEVEVGKIIIHNAQVIEINPKIAYICVRLNDYDKLIFSDSKGKWSEFNIITNEFPLSTGRFISKDSNPFNHDIDVYEYLYPITQLDTNLGWFRIGVDFTKDSEEFKSFLIGIVSFEIGLFFLLVFFSYYFALKITAPILELHEGVKKFADGNKNVEVNIQSQNELLDLAVSFNQMTKRIAQINEELEFKVLERTKELEENMEKLNLAQEKARLAAMQAGMAEIATNVLHNVGNVLNSVNVSVGSIKEILNNSCVNNLPKITNLINQNRENIGAYLSNDSRGKLIPEYLNELSNEILKEDLLFKTELERLIIKVNSIKEIIVLQQDYAWRSEVKEIVDVKDLINEAVVITGLNLSKFNITLKLQLIDLPKIYINKHKAIQILVNLLKNSKEALVSMVSNNDKWISIELKLEPSKLIRIYVTDNGEGIDALTLNRIFEHGFTTKNEGHGYGLHSCAIDAKKLGGQLLCNSKGKGFGTVFIFELPIE